MLTSMRPPPLRLQRGVSLVELLVGITVGLFVVAAAAMLVGSQLAENRQLLLETQLQQDLRSSADIITRELRRAGYWNQSQQGIWTPTVTPVPNPRAVVGMPVANQVEYTYNRGPGQQGPYGFKLNTVTGSIQTQLAAAGWQDLTDSRTLRITALTITPNNTTVPLPCPKACPAVPLANAQDCWPQLVIRSFDVTMTGQAVHDSAVRRTLTTNVRLRNDRVDPDRSNPASTQYCPA
jgi:type IV pilus assembly protein PilW